MLSNPAVFVRDDAIPIDADGALSDVFFAFINQTFGEEADAANLTAHTVTGLIELADKYDCPVFIRRIRLTLMNESAAIAPWPLFKIAARLDSVRIAKAAILRSSSYKGNARGTAAMYEMHTRGSHTDGVDQRYVQALMHAELTAWRQLAHKLDYQDARKPIVMGKGRAVVREYTKPDADVVAARFCLE